MNADTITLHLERQTIDGIKAIDMRLDVAALERYSVDGLKDVLWDQLQLLDQQLADKIIRECVTNPSGTGDAHHCRICGILGATPEALLLGATCLRCGTDLTHITNLAPPR